LPYGNGTTTLERKKKTKLLLEENEEKTEQESRVSKIGERTTREKDNEFWF